MRKAITKDIVNELRPAGKLGRPPIVKHCPHCHGAFNVTQMRRHQPACALDHKSAPPQPRTMPGDLENQVLSTDPLQRLRQLDQREQDRIQRS